MRQLRLGSRDKISSSAFFFIIMGDNLTLECHKQKEQVENSKINEFESPDIKE